MAAGKQSIEALSLHNRMEIFPLAIHGDLAHSLQKNNPKKERNSDYA
jgi:hypothetical protein